MRASWLPPLLLLAALPGQVPLRGLAALARARAERLRPAQEQALEPYWADLALDYRDNSQFLDQQIAKVVALGDSIVPLLLEKLQPATENGSARNLADNCRRALERLDPQSFLDALLELLAGSHEVGRKEAILLLGHTQSKRAVAALADAFGQGRPEERHLLLAAFTRLRATEVAARVVPLLGSNDRGVRDDVLDYLVAARPTDVVPTVLQALTVEKDNRLLPRYVEYFAAAASENDAVAKALLPLLDDGRLDWQDNKRLVQVLATVAPKNHDPTLRRMHEILDRGETGTLGLQAALTLRSLGDKNGVKKLQAALTDQLRRPQRRKEAPLYEQRGNLYLAIEEYTDAIDDFERVLEFSQSSSQKRAAQLKLARCEAHKRHWSKVLDYLKMAAPTAKELQDLGQEDAAVQEALQQERIRGWAASLQPDGGGH